MKRLFVILGLLLSATVVYAQSNGFAPNGNYTAAFSVTTASSTKTLPTGAMVVVYNTGTVNAYCALGNSSVTATTNNDVIYPNGFMGFTRYNNSTIACLTSTSGTTLNISGGAGIAAGASGAASGGGSGGSVTQGTVPWIVAGQISNASSAVSTSSLNVGTNAYNYGFNGSTWDQLQVDANKFLKNVPQATENHIGEVGGNILPITNAMTTSNNTVTTGKSVGGLQTLANSVRVSGSLGASGTSGIIQSVLLSFKDAIGSVPFDVYYFNANPTGSTCTDNTTFALVDADRDKTIFIAHVTDITASNTAAIAQAGNMAIPFGLSSATSMYACVVSRGSAAITGTANASLITRVLRN